MPVSSSDLERSPSSQSPITELPFPPLTKSHILNCSYHSWHSPYRSLTPKARLIPLSSPFLTYLREDGILLPPDAPSSRVPGDPLTPPPSDRDDSDLEDDETADPSLAWPEIHSKIKSTIAELGGSVTPKLNWSAPKDATWISATNSMECRAANDIYLLLKSSDFVTHDLEQVFDACEDEDDETSTIGSESNEGGEEENLQVLERREKEKALSKIPYHLVLRKTIPAYNPALEFRCFVRSRNLLCLCQRDLNHYSFLPGLLPKLRPLISEFFEKNLQHHFPDENFVFDVYVPPPHQRAWLIDINPWAVRTDPLLFSWLEILRMPGPSPIEPSLAENENQEPVPGESVTNNATSENEEEEEAFTPEFRLINRDDPEAYSFNTPQYSAHKLPKDVVDAGNDGEAGLREFMGTWREIVRRQEADERDDALGERS